MNSSSSWFWNLLLNTGIVAFQCFAPYTSRSRSSWCWTRHNCRWVSKECFLHVWHPEIVIQILCSRKISFFTWVDFVLERNDIRIAAAVAVAAAAFEEAGISCIVEASVEPYSWYSTVASEDSQRTLSKFASFFAQRWTVIQNPRLIRIHLEHSGSEYKYCASICVSPLLKHHLPNLSSLSEECASTCASKSSRLTVKGYNQTRMPCVGSSFFISFAGSRFLVVCLSESVSIGFPACMLVTSSRHWIW